MTATAETRPDRAGWREAFAVYLQPRVLIVMFLGFSAGLPLALSGSTLAGLDARGGRRSWRHRPLHPGRHALHHQVPVGAGGRCARRADTLPPARPSAWLAGTLAAHADRGDRAARPVQPEDLALVCGVRRGIAGGGGLGHPGHRRRCLPRGKPGRARAGRRHGVLRRGLPDRHPGLDRRRPLRGQRLRMVRHGQGRCLVARLRGHGGVRRDRNSRRACGHRARALGRGRRRACARGRRASVQARGEGRDQRVLRIPHARRWRLWCSPSWFSSSSAMRSRAP